MIRVYHIDVGEVSRRRLVCYVYRVLERQVPDRERLEFRVTGVDAAFSLVIYLRQTRRQLARSGAGRGHDDEGARRGYEIVCSVAVVARYGIYIVRVTFDDAVDEYALASDLQFLFEYLRGRLTDVLGYDDCGDVDIKRTEPVDQTQDVRIVRDAVIGADLFALYVRGVYDNDYLKLVLQLREKSQLRIGRESRQDP